MQDRFINISGGTFHQSNLSTGSIHQTVHNRQSGADDLRAVLREHRDELIRLAGDRGPRAARDLDKIDQQLGEPEPEAEAVRAGWKSVAGMVTGAGSAAESLTKIADLVRSVFG